jgi:uncharacterized membrane protein YphA (DoxX/SURF4 family)
MNRRVALGYHLTRLILAAIFLYAGALKALDPVGFAGQVAAYQLLPYAGNLVVAAALPYVELVVGLLLLGNRLVRPAALLLVVLNGIFIVALASAWARGLQIDCGCFHPEAATTPQTAIVRDLLFIALAVTLFRLRGQLSR